MISPEALQSLLVPPGLVDEAAFAQAVEQSKRSHEALEEVLIDQGVIEELKLGAVIAGAYGVPFVNLREKVLDSDVVRRVPEALARHKRLLLYDLDNERGYLAMLEPGDPETVNAISRSLGMPVEVSYALDRAISGMLRHYQSDLHAEFSGLLRQSVPGGGDSEVQTTANLPIEQIVETIVRYAYQNRASDIHLEPMEKEVAIRFRVDGILRDVVPLATEAYPLIVARIKLLSRLRTDEHFAAQDGKFQVNVGEEQLDIRVSIIPALYGEKIVMRLLSKKLQRFTLEDLGYRKEDLRKVREAFMRPHGMILATGPTGSGKTTTLYAILKTLNTREVNITTIEDPIEYQMDGVNQIQVNSRTDLTFARGLRSILRQDPDIVMVGEIRDEETANIAINAALTGHLVLSTLHTNDAPTTLPRLLDMHVEAFLIASSVNVAIGQRLVRRICSQCIVSTAMTESQRDVLLRLLPANSPLCEQLRGDTRVYVGKGCPVCHGTGFTGRVGIYEVLLVDEDIKKLIVEKASSDVIKRAAQAKGMTTMLEDGVEKVSAGMTTVEEVLRATQE